MSEEHSGHHVNYFFVFGFLCVMTAISVVADVVHIDSKVVLAVIVLAVATAKALAVMMFFMHLKFEGNWKFVLLAPTIILAIGLPLALLPDVGIHYYTMDVPQLEAAEHSGDATTDDHQPENPH